MQPSTNGTHKPKPADAPPPCGPTTRAFASAPDDPNYFLSFGARLGRLFAARDYLSLGNAVIETLMRPGQDKSPDECCKVVDQFMPQVVLEYCGIAECLTYPRPYSDEHVEFADRDTWEKDRFVELVIQAFMIGASIRKLPNPYGYNLCLYQLLAIRQRIAINEAHLRGLDATLPEQPDPTRRPCRRCPDLLVKFKPLFVYLDAVRTARPDEPLPCTTAAGPTSPASRMRAARRRELLPCHHAVFRALWPNSGDMSGQEGALYRALDAFQRSAYQHLEAGKSVPQEPFTILDRELEAVYPTTPSQAMACIASEKARVAAADLYHYCKSRRDEVARRSEDLNGLLPAAERAFRQEEAENRHRAYIEAIRARDLEYKAEEERRRQKAADQGREDARARAGLGESALARDVRELLDSDLDESLKQAEMRRLLAAYGVSKPR